MESALAMPYLMVGVRAAGKAPLPLGSLFRYTLFMAKSAKVHLKKRRGRPATGKDPLVSARMPSALIAEVEAWAEANQMSRSQAFRQLVEHGLKGKGT